jgi:hypothetical protein
MLLDRPDLDMQTYLFCFEKINKKATACKHCGRDIPVPVTKMEEGSS